MQVMERIRMLCHRCFLGESCGCPNVILTDEMLDPAARCDFSFLLALLVIFFMLSSNLTDSDYQPNQGHSHLTRH